MKHFANTVRSTLAKRAEYNRLVAEIEGLSARDSDDLGIRRGDAREIARTAVYG